MSTPISQLIEELNCDVRNIEKVIKRSGLTDCQKKIAEKSKQTLTDVLFNLETRYLNLEVDYLNKLKK